MDIYKNGYVYQAAKGITSKGNIVCLGKYPCPQPHPDWKDGKDVTGKWEIYETITDNVKAIINIAVPIQQEQLKEQDDLNQKNIDFASEAVAESVFYHYQDSTQKGKLKTALKMFANILLQQAPKQ